MVPREVPGVTKAMPSHIEGLVFANRLCKLFANSLKQGDGGMDAIRTLGAMEEGGIKALVNLPLHLLLACQLNLQGYSARKCRSGC